MCACHNWFNWSVMLVMAAALFASLPPGRIFLAAAAGPTRLSMSNPKASLVISKEDVDAGKISYRAIVTGSSCLTTDIDENQMTLVGGIGGCRMNIMLRENKNRSEKTSSLVKTNPVDGPVGVPFSSSSVSVDLFKSGGGALNNIPKDLVGCTIVSKPNNNTVQNGKVVDFSVENIQKTCPDIAIEFDERYKLYKPPGSLDSGTPEDNNDNTVLIVCLSLAGALILLTAIGFGLWCLWKHRQKNSMPAAPTDVKVLLTQGMKPEDSPDMPKVTVISNTHVKTTQPKPTPDTKPRSSKLDSCPTEETEIPSPKVVVSSKKKEKAQPKVVINSKKQEEPSKKRAANKVKETVEKFGPLPPMHKKCKKGKSAVFADLSKIEDYKTPASTCKTKEPNTMERSAQRNKCVEETSVEEQKPTPSSTKNVPRFQKDYDDYVSSLEANKLVDKPEPEKQPLRSAKRQPRLRKGMDPYVSSLENQ